MAAEEYEVDARLEFNSPKVISALDKIAGQLRGMSERLRGVNIGFKGIVGSAIALGATYFSINAITRGITGFGKSVMSANADVESMSLSLATVYSAVEKISFKDAISDAGNLFDKLRILAIESPSTTTELMNIFQGIYGPLRRGGLTMNELLETTKNTAIAAAALGVDFEQAQRDISMMARGTAGLEVKTFSLLRSMGLIKETTEEWNKLAPDKRAKRIMDVMAQMGGEAGEAYGRTWKGLTSTFKDIMDSFKRAFGTAVFERMRATLERINNYLLENRELIESNLSRLGERVGEAFDRLINRGAVLYANATANIDAIRAKLEHMIERYHELKPIITQAAKVAAVMSAASFAIGTVAPIVGGLVSALSFIPTLVSGIMSFAGMLSAAFGPIVAAFEMFSLTVSTAGFGGAMLALGEIVLAAVAPFALVIAVIAALVAGFLKFKDTIISMARPLVDSFKTIGKQLYDIFRDLWLAVKPVLEVLGGALIMQVIAQLRIMAWVLANVLLPPIRLAAGILRWFGEEVVKPIAELLGDAMKKAVEGFNWVGEKISVLGDAIQRVVDFILDKINAIGDLAGDAWDAVSGGGPTDASDAKFWSDFIKSEKARRDAAAMKAVEDTVKANAKINQDVADAIAKSKREAREKELLNPSDRPKVVNDFRGSKIEVHQDFRNADPDRVWIQLRSALEREALQRTQSGFVAPLTR